METEFPSLSVHRFTNKNDPSQTDTAGTNFPFVSGGEVRWFGEMIAKNNGEERYRLTCRCPMGPFSSLPSGVSRWEVETLFDFNQLIGGNGTNGHQWEAFRFGMTPNPSDLTDQAEGVGILGNAWSVFFNNSWGLQMTCGGGQTGFSDVSLPDTNTVLPMRIRIGRENFGGGVTRFVAAFGGPGSYWGQWVFAAGAGGGTLDPGLTVSPGYCTAAIPIADLPFYLFFEFSTARYTADVPYMKVSNARANYLRMVSAADPYACPCCITSSSSSSSSTSVSSSSSSESSSSCGFQTFTLAGGTSKGNYSHSSLISFADSQTDPYDSFGNTNILAETVSIFDTQWTTRRAWFRVSISLRYVPFLYNFTYLRFRGTLVTATNGVPNVPASARFVLVGYQGVTEPPSPTDFTSQGIRYTDPFILLAGAPAQTYTVPLITDGVDYLNSQLAVSASTASFWLVEYDRDYFGGTPVAFDERVYFDFNVSTEPNIFADCSISSSSSSLSSSSESSSSESSSSESSSSSSSSLSSSSESAVPALTAYQQSSGYPGSWFSFTGVGPTTWALRYYAAIITNYGSNVRVEIGYIGVSYTIQEMWIGVGDPVGDIWDWASPPSQLLFSGSPSLVVNNTGYVSDWLPFTIAPATDYVIRFYHNTPDPNAPPGFFATGTGPQYTLKAGVNEASGPLDSSGYSYPGDRDLSIIKIEVF